MAPVRSAERKPFGYQAGPIRRLLLCVGFLALQVIGADPPATQETVVQPRSSTDTLNSLAARREVIVVDFFAPWCVPCLEASRRLRTEVGQWYQERGGNPAGLPVRVLSVNIDTSAPNRTERFLRATGVTEVVADEGGVWFRQLGGQALPYLALFLLESGACLATTPPQAVYEGMPELTELRARIDGLGRPGGGSGTGAAAPVPFAEERGFPGRLLAGPAAGLLELQTEALVEDDFRLFQSGLTWRETRPVWNYLTRISWQRYDLHYQPAASDFISQPTRLQEDQVAFQGRLRTRVADGWQAELSGGAYTGFSDYRSVWLDEYYRQFFEAVPGYRAADPGGFHAAPGVRWDWIPGVAIVQATFLYQSDEVSPGYEKQPFRPLVRGTDRLETYAGSLSLEHLVGRNTRVAHEARITATTDRDLRYAYKGSINQALSESWVAKVIAGATWEPPDFHAWFAQASVEYDWGDRWFAGVLGRLYSDNGLLQDPKIPSNAAPPLESLRLGASLRFEGRRLSGRLAAGPYLTRYDDLPAVSADFATLYADRDWWYLEAALAWRL